MKCENTWKVLTQGFPLYHSLLLVKETVKLLRKLKRVKKKKKSYPRIFTLWFSTKFQSLESLSQIHSQKNWRQAEHPGGHATVSLCVVLMSYSTSRPARPVWSSSSPPLPQSPAWLLLILHIASLNSSNTISWGTLPTCWISQVHLKFTNVVFICLFVLYMFL